VRGDQLARQWQLIQRLARSRTGVGVARLTKDLECTRRTLYRDLDALRYAGFPIIDEKRDGRVYYKFIDSFGLGDIPFTPDEAMALALSEDLLRTLEGTVFHDSVCSALSKVRASLGPELTQYLEQYRQTLRIIPEPHKHYKESRETIRTLQQAALEHHSVHIHYRSASSGGQETERTLDPYRVWYRSGGLYVVGFDHRSKQLRTFAVERILEINTLESTFSIRSDFDFETFIGAAFGVISDEATLVRIRFASTAKPYVEERTWHPTQELCFLENGELELAMHVGNSSELRSWILSFGVQATVLEPEELREAIHRELSTARKNYLEPTP